VAKCRPYMCYQAKFGRSESICVSLSSRSHFPNWVLKIKKLIKLAKNIRATKTSSKSVTWVWVMVRTSKRTKRRTKNNSSCTLTTAGALTWAKSPPEKNPPESDRFRKRMWLTPRSVHRLFCYRRRRRRRIFISPKAKEKSQYKHNQTQRRVSRKAHAHRAGHS